VRRPLVTVTLLLVVWGTPRVGAQEMNYNTFQVGSRSSLMGGAVVGGVRDTSAAFYNPGALGFVANPDISVSANAFRFGKVTIADALGPGEDATATLLDPIPLLVSGILPWPAAPQWAFGYALVARQLYTATFTHAVDTPREALTVGGVSLPLPTQFLAQSNITSRANEFWAMGAVAWRPSATLALGLAPIVALRRQSLIERFAIQTIPRGDGVTMPIGGNAFTDIDFDQFSLGTRFGVAWEPHARLKVGATLTTPNLKLVSSGSSQAQVTVNNIPVLTNGSIQGFQSLAGSDFQEGLSAHYRTPLSIAVGAEVTPWTPLTVGLTVDYSVALGHRALLDVQGGRPFFRGPGTEGRPDSTAFLTPLDERRTVVNVSVGAAYALNETYAAYVGFWTDFSPLTRQQVTEILRSNQGVVLATGEVDLYHVVFGATRTTQRSTVAVGVGLSHGTGSAPSNVDITPTGDVLGLTQGGRVIARDVSFWSLSLLLGYTYYF
jgi:hypothetical protein